LYDIRRLLAFADTVGMPRAALAPLILGHPDAILECDSTVALQGVDIIAWAVESSASSFCERFDAAAVALRAT
jgi:hypothetical protein